jgi:hypothetical protein
VGAEAQSDLSLRRSTQVREVLDYDVVEELARLEFNLHEWEAIAPEDLYRAWCLLQHDERLRHAP